MGKGPYNFAGFNEARDAVHETALEKGWWEPQLHEDGTARVQRSFGESMALVHSEASEALEEHRKGNFPTYTYFPAAGAHGPTAPSFSLEEIWARNHGWKPEGIPSEVADIIIRALDIAGHYGIDIEQALKVKSAYNATRPYRHGGKKL